MAAILPPRQSPPLFRPAASVLRRGQPARHRLAPVPGFPAYRDGWCKRLRALPEQEPELSLPFSPVGPTAGMLAHLIASEQGYLVQSAAEQRLEELAQQLLDATASGSDAGGESGEGGMGLLHTRMAAVRRKEALMEAQSLLYLCCAARLQEQGVSLQASFLQGNHNSTVVERAAEALQPALVDAIGGHISSSLGGGSMPLDTTAHVAQDQLAGLYLGTMEFGYFLRAVRARMEEVGAPLGEDSANLLLFAESLSADELRRVTQISSQEAFNVAMLHSAKLFELELAPGATGSAEELYPQLRPLSGVAIAPTAHLLEHFDDPERAEDLRGQAASKAERGWGDAAQRDVAEADGALPTPSLVEANLGALSTSLLEASVLGHALWEAERQLELVFPLTPRSA
mmetsp:Transcript_39216/g.98545  ORF Transcript_39216/g.98545 Transcript_39216/m.98545 type:complete len:400 (-) Transcript_39216:214-1413(-)|eukprot:jgi/Tetstr1/438056/TSEL_026682.t1